MIDKKYSAKLTDEQYDVLFNNATEAPFSGEYDQEFKPGIYACAACGTQLFESGTKFDAHCGWPSFYDAIPSKVTLHEDTSLGMKRIEVTCATCGGHLGHLFKGEKFGNPINQRYCINSLSLRFSSEIKK